MPGAAVELGSARTTVRESTITHATPEVERRTHAVSHLRGRAAQVPLPRARWASNADRVGAFRIAANVRRARGLRLDELPSTLVPFLASRNRSRVKTSQVRKLAPLIETCGLEELGYLRHYRVDRVIAISAATSRVRAAAAELVSTSRGRDREWLPFGGTRASVRSSSLRVSRARGAETSDGSPTPSSCACGFARAWLS